MKTLILLPLSQADMRSIWLYSAEHWGRKQANAYLDDLRTAMKLIAERPESGKRCDDVREGYRQMAVGSHFIFYKVADETVCIIRVLHQSMDFQRHL